MLPLGRKNSRKCSECDITCHANCAHLVPDFCGMSMETANQLLRDWRDINRARGGKATAVSKQTAPTHAPQQYQHSPVSSVDMSQNMQQLKLVGTETPDYFGHQNLALEGRPPDPRFQQAPQTYSPPPSTPSRPPTGTRISPGYDQQQLPPSVRPSYEPPPPGALDPFAKLQHQVIGFYWLNFSGS